MRRTALSQAICLALAMPLTEELWSEDLGTWLPFGEPFHTPRFYY